MKGKLLGRLDLPGRLGDRTGQGDDVGLLEAHLPDRAIALHLVSIDLAGDEDRRGRVEIAAGDAGHQVGRPGATGGHRDAWHARHPGISFGRKGRALLVVHAHDADPIGLVERVQEVDDHPAHEFEDALDALLVEEAGDDVRPFWHPSLPPW